MIQQWASKARAACVKIAQMLTGTATAAGDHQVASTESIDSAPGTRLLLHYDRKAKTFLFGVGYAYVNGLRGGRNYLNPIPAASLKKLLYLLQNPPSEDAEVFINDSKTLRCCYLADDGSFVLRFAFAHDGSSGEPRQDEIKLYEPPTLIDYLSARMPEEIARTEVLDEPKFGLEA